MYLPVWRSRICVVVFSKQATSLWYEPDAVVAHRAPAARLKRPYFVGRAYWQGRSEVLARYADKNETDKERLHARHGILHAILPELREICYLALLHRPLLVLAGRSTAERLEAAMAQARRWGHLRQRLQFFEHAPIEVMNSCRAPGAFCRAGP